jgi:DNA-directed RNA polymerase specialized sigma24 family protein
MSNEKKPSQPRKGPPRRKGGKPTQTQGKGQGGRQGQGQGKGQGKGQVSGPRRNAPDGDDRVAELAGPLSRVLQRLPETQRRVLELRMGLVDGYSRNLSDTASELGLSMHEAKEIEARAFEHIREVVPLNQLKKLLKG